MYREHDRSSGINNLESQGAGLHSATFASVRRSGMDCGGSGKQHATKTSGSVKRRALLAANTGVRVVRELIKAGISLWYDSEVNYIAAARNFSFFRNRSRLFC